MADWREGSSCLRNLISKFYNLSGELLYTDITINLPDGSLVTSHKFILAIASPFFEAQFFGLLAIEDQKTIKIQDVNSNSFRRLLDFIYNSEAQDWEMERLDYWDLLHAANMYLVPELIKHCTNKIEDSIRNHGNLNELVIHINKASECGYAEEIYKTGLVVIKKNLVTLVKQDVVWGQVDCDVVLDIVEDDNLNITEGELFTAMVNWCKANTSSEIESVELFREKFVEKVLVQNISLDIFNVVIGPSSNYLSADVLKKWTFEVKKNKMEEGTRMVLNPLKIFHTTIEGKDLRESTRLAASNFSVSKLWTEKTEYTNVNIEVYIGVSRNGVLALKTVHKPKVNRTTEVNSERVSVKMIVKKHDGTIIKKVRPVQDGTNVTSVGNTNNVFVLSSHPQWDKREDWSKMEFVVTIDCRPTCDIKAIFEEDYCISVCTSFSLNYIDKAMPFQFNVNTHIDDAMKSISMAMGNHQKENQGDFTSRRSSRRKISLTQWVYNSKGFVSNLRSWIFPNVKKVLVGNGTEGHCNPETMGDIMRLTNLCDFPNNYKTWVIARENSKSKREHVDQKMLFVCSYNNESQEIKYKGNICITTQTQRETQDLTNPLQLGTVAVTDDFLSKICFGFTEISSKIFIRRVFPNEDESDPEIQKLLVTEIVKGQQLTHVDNCHVIVIQENGPGINRINYDQFILKKIREMKILFKSRCNKGTCFEAMLDSDSGVDIVTETLAQLAMISISHIRIYECYSGRNMVTRSAEFPIDTESDVKLAQMFNHCKDNPKTIYYEALD